MMLPLVSSSSWNQTCTISGAFARTALAAGFDVLAARMTALEQGHAEQNAHSLRDEDMSGRLYLVQEKMLRVLTADCVNHADSAEGRRACVQ